MISGVTIRITFHDCNFILVIKSLIRPILYASILGLAGCNRGGNDVGMQQPLEKTVGKTYTPDKSIRAKKSSNRPAI